MAGLSVKGYADLVIGQGKPHTCGSLGQRRQQLRVAPGQQGADAGVHRRQRRITCCWKEGGAQLYAFSDWISTTSRTNPGLT
jgi:hypothetical protein